MIVVEERKTYRGFGEANANQTQQNAGLGKTIGDLINSFIQSQVIAYKYRQAVKMAEPACKKDPDHCDKYIYTALASLGVTPDPMLIRQISEKYGQKKPSLDLYNIPDENKNDDTLKYLLIGGGILAGILAVYFITKND